MTQDFSPLIELVLAGVYYRDNFLDNQIKSIDRLEKNIRLWEIVLKFASIRY